MFDSHCHLHEDSAYQDVAAIVERARALGVEGMLLAGVDSRGWARQIALAHRFERLYNAVGIHPHVVKDLSDDALSAMLGELEPLVALATRDLSVRAVGETGLDGRSEYRATLDRQEILFRAQLKLAREVDLPVVLHIVESHARALEILEEDGLPAATGVLHSCSAPAELVPRYLALGLFISFAGTICHPHAKRVHAAARAVPIERLLAETDAPFQLPSTLRVLEQQPPPNEPANVALVIDALAKVRGEPLGKIARATETNAYALLRAAQ